MITPSLSSRVRELLGDLRRARGVVAVSGGPDSVALACILRSLPSDGQAGGVVFAHLNHQLRGSESDADEAFVRKLAEQLHVPFRCHRLDVATLARESGDNLENCARRLRYEWLTQVANEVGAAWVATGHTADDQAETVLFRLLRGTGLHGLTGIPATRELAPGITLLRPLLSVRRAELLAFLHEQRQGYRQDSSNCDLRLSRNRLRHELLPRLTEQYNPAIVTILDRLAEQAREVEGLIQPLVEQLWREAELPRAGAMLVFQASVLARANPHLAREALRLAWTREKWPAGEMTFADWDRLAALAAASAGAHDFPAKIRARRIGRVLQIGPIQ